MKAFALLLLCFLLAPTVLAQEQAPKEEEKMVDLMFLNYKNRLELLKIQDNLLKTLLKVPFEKRVYVYPALFESHTIPKKILTHPQILMWKGKKPTRIAPQLQEYAKEYLDTMPAQLYPYLDPDGWPQNPKEDDWHNVTKLIADTIVDPNTTPNIPVPNDIK